MGPICLHAIEASALSSATPRLPLIQPVFARLKWHVTPDTLGLSNASIIILWFEPKKLKMLSTDPISSAYRLDERINNSKGKTISACERNN